MGRQHSGCLCLACLCYLSACLGWLPCFCLAWLALFLHCLPCSFAFELTLLGCSLPFVLLAGALPPRLLRPPSLPAFLPALHAICQALCAAQHRKSSASRPACCR